MQTNTCSDCTYNDMGLVSRRCPVCHAANVAAMVARTTTSTGGQSSPDEDKYKPTMYASGEYTGRGETAGGGKRVIRGTHSLGG